MALIVIGLDNLISLVLVRWDTQATFAIMELMTASATLALMVAPASTILDIITAHVFLDTRGHFVKQTSRSVPVFLA